MTTETDTATTDPFTRENPKSVPEDFLPLTNEEQLLLANDADEASDDEPDGDGDASYYFGGIQASWYKTVKGNMRTARWCAAADKREVRKKVVELLTEHRVMTEPTFSKMVQIGNDKRLQAIEHLLPPHYSTIYEVAQLKTDANRDELEEAVKDGKISPSLQRGELAAWLEEKGYRTPGAPRTSASLPEAFFAAVRLNKDDAPAEELDRINALLQSIKDECPSAEIVRPKDQNEEYLKKMGRWHERVQKRVRKGARELVRKYIKGFKPKLRKSLHLDRLEIPNDADRERILEVLETIHRHDEYERLVATAEREVPQPKYPK